MTTDEQKKEEPRKHVGEIIEELEAKISALTSKLSRSEAENTELRKIIENNYQHATRITRSEALKARKLGIREGWNRGKSNLYITRTEHSDGPYSTQTSSPETVEDFLRTIK